jgi:hypothetical protein
MIVASLSLQNSQSVCNQSCLSGFRIIPQEGRSICCFTCGFCPDRHISNQTGRKYRTVPKLYLPLNSNSLKKYKDICDGIIVYHCFPFTHCFNISLLKPHCYVTMCKLLSRGAHTSTQPWH